MALLRLVLAAILLTRAVATVEVLLYLGHEYRTRDGASPTETNQNWNGGCEDSYVELPAGWELAPDTTDARSVAGDTPGNGRWGTSCMVMANGKAYFSFENDATPNDCSSDFNSGQLGTSGSSYKANNCNLRLLLRRPCAAGTYHGATKTVATEADAACSASPCPAGTYSATTGATSSAACSSILNAGSPCAAGKYGAAVFGTDTCADCRAGSYSPATGNDNEADCVQCGTGRYSTAVGATEVATCQECAVGKFSAQMGANSESTCSLCEPGKYMETTASSACTLCIGGKYAVVSGATSPTTCTSCDAGTSSHSTGTTCIPCGAGTYAPTSSSTACTPCPAGTYSSSMAVSTSSMCFPCAAGKFSAALGATSAAACGSSCPAGSYSNPGAVACQPCLAGKYSTSAGNGDVLGCVDCEAGKYTASEGNTEEEDCTMCVAGKYSSSTGANNVNTCEDCVIGKFGSSPGSDNVVDCIECIKGKYSTMKGNNKETDCVSCVAGTYSTSVGASSTDTCLLCVAGTYSLTEGNTAEHNCIDCASGTYSGVIGSASSTSCVACGKGKYSSSTGATSEGTCQNCIPGTYLETEANSAPSDCVGCGEGKYSSASGATDGATCENCLAGKYVASVGSDSKHDCGACTEGKYSTEDGAVSATVCLDCASGKYSVNTASTSVDMCSDCDSGKYSEEAASSTCFNCEAGKYSTVTGLTFCSKCTAGKYSAGTGLSSPDACSKCGTGQYSLDEGATSNATCLKCVPGTYAEIEGLASCRVCVAGKYSSSTGANNVDSCEACAAGKFGSSPGSDNVADCIECTKGKYSQEQGASSKATCTMCSIGRYSSILGAPICTECPATNATCVDCPGGKYLSVGVGATSLSECSRCAAGSTISMLSCSSCSKGTFSKAGSLACSVCGVNTDSAAGSVACACKAGFFLEGMCKACPPGSFKTTLSDSPCNTCLKDTYTSAVASTVCMGCRDGYTSPQGSSTESACQEPQAQQAPGGPRIEFQVTLPYNSVGFTATLQKRFKDAIAVVAGAGCVCAIGTEDVKITRTSEVSRRVLVGRPPTSRRQPTSKSISVDVSIAVPNIEKGNLLVQNDFLTKDTMNEELSKMGLALITHVTASPVLKETEASDAAASTALSTSTETSSSGAQTTGIIISSSGAQTTGIIIAVFAVIAMAAGVAYYCVRRHRKVNATADEVPRRKEEQEATQEKRAEEEVRKRRAEEEARKRREEETRRTRRDEEEARKRRQDEEARKRLGEVKTARNQRTATLQFLPQRPYQTQEEKRKEEGKRKYDVLRVRLDPSRHSIDFTTNLGSGSFADVKLGAYRFPGQQKAQPVACKVYRGGQSLPASMRDQIEQELALGIQLNHPNLVKIYGWVELPGHGPSLVLELAGRSVRAVLDDSVQTPSLPWKMRVKWLLDIACGMFELHALLPRGIVHRDLKTANVLLVEDMTLAKITDFGVAMTLDTYRSMSSAASSGAAGTMSFKAPETFDGHYSQASDVFALAVTSFEICTRAVPYPDLSGPEINKRAMKRFEFDEDLTEHYDHSAQLAMWQKKNPLHSRRPDLSHVQAGCPQVLVDCIVTCWSDDAKDRPTFKECRQFLEGLLEARRHIPQHWLSDQTTAHPSKAFEFVRSVDPQVLRNLQKMLQGNHIGQVGRNHQGPPKYKSLQLQDAWQIENRSLWSKYESERSGVKQIMTRMTEEQRSQMPHPNLRTPFAEAGRELAESGEAYEAMVHEVHLLHGLGDPSMVHTIVAGGFNEHFSGGNRGTLFGNGIYMTEDVGKANEYCRPASRNAEQRRVNQMLYGSSDDPLHVEELRYIFVCRSTLGCIVQVGQDTDHRLSTKEPVFAAGTRELALVPDHLISTPTHFHSELAEVAPAPGFVADDTHTEVLGIDMQFREFIVFRPTLIFPEYLLTFKREKEDP